MRTSRRIAWGVAAALVLGAAAFGQESGEATGGGPCVMVGIANTTIVSGNSKNSPIMATEKISFEQKLADGNAIHSIFYLHEARDAAGRVRREEFGGCAPSRDGESHRLTRVSIYDPVNRTNTSWMAGDNAQSKIATVFHMPEPVQRPVQTPQTLTPGQIAARQMAMEAAQERSQRTKVRSLGLEAFAGITAEGRRTTETIPAGQEGNDLPIEIVTESWNSTDLGLMLKSYHSDPRRGAVTVEVVNVTRNEPEPSVFAPPAGYTIRDQHPNSNANGN